MPIQGIYMPGGSICAYFAAKHPEKVDKIAFLSPLFDKFEGKEMASVLKVKGIGEYLMNIMGDKFLTNPSRVL
jgi:pimeloyl-ACP methyl ester carboxylesterase